MITGVLFLSPWIIGFAFFMVLPVALSMYFSLCDYSVLNPPALVGLQNYQDLVSDEIFWLSLNNTLIFAAVGLPMTTVLSLGLALLLNGNIPLRGVFRTVFFIPSLVPLVAVAVLWQEVLNTEYGIVNRLLLFLGLGPFDWLGNPDLAKPALVITGLWSVGNAVVIYLAGLQDVPRSLYEAARVDGASIFQQFVNVTLPMLSPVIYFNVIMGTIGVLQVFALPYVMTGGGPARSTLFYTMYLFDQAFSYLNMGYASAMAWVLFAIIAFLTYVGHVASRKHVTYGSDM